MHLDWSITMAHCRVPAVELAEASERPITRVAVTAPAPSGS